MLVSDVLVTDYSSVIYEFALLGRPIAFLAPDDGAYDEERGFYFDFRRDAPGPIVDTTEELAALIRANAFDLERVAAFRDASFDVPPGGAAARLVDHVIIPALRGGEVTGGVDRGGPGALSRRLRPRRRHRSGAASSRPTRRTPAPTAIQAVSSAASTMPPISSATSSPIRSKLVHPHRQLVELGLEVADLVGHHARVDRVLVQVHARGSSAFPSKVAIVRASSSRFCDAPANGCAAEDGDVERARQRLPCWPMPVSRTVCASPIASLEVSRVVPALLHR